ncbi:MAG TPA: hypothetical protein VGA73_14555 [Candidatus Binatia bacterium]
MKARILLQAAAVLAPLSFYGAAEACSVCINGAAGQQLTDAFNWSVLFLMAMPYTIVFSIAGFFFFAYRRAAQKAETTARETEAGAPALPLAWSPKESGR